MSDEDKKAVSAAPAPKKIAKPTIDDQIAEISGVLEMRRAIYPQYVIAKDGYPLRMSQAEADLRIANTEAALATLQLVKAHAGAFRKLVADAKKGAKDGNAEVHEPREGDGSAA